MRSSLLMTLIGAASLAAALLVGCGDNDAKPVSSKLGQSCARTADCADGLSCIANVCYSNSAAAGGSGGSGGSAVVGPVLGGDGESCTSRKDCEDGLACFNQRCTKSSIGAGGDTGNGPTAQLGAQGETCRVNADCAANLACVPINLVGVCEPTNFGVTPTGKDCEGECATATDCCQLPTDEQVKDCPDLAAQITLNGVVCTDPQMVGSQNARLCFLDAAYCTGCTATTWKCAANACVYNAACTVAAGFDSPKGCPDFTRLNSSLLGLGCNTKTLKCTGDTTPCTTDASCVGMAVTDNPLDLCSDGECTCYATDHHCYRQCARDLDCATGRVCDKTSSLCVPDTKCTMDSECADRSENLDFKCQMATNTCVQTCTTDRDCSGSGHLGDSAFLRVCADGLCTSIVGDCIDDTQCGMPNGYKMFCADRKPIGADAPVSSAVTN